MKTAEFEVDIMIYLECPHCGRDLEIDGFLSVPSCGDTVDCHYCMESIELDE